MICILFILLMRSVIGFFSNFLKKNLNIIFFIINNTFLKKDYRGGLLQIYCRFGILNGPS